MKNRVLMLLMVLFKTTIAQDTTIVVSYKFNGNTGDSSGNNYHGVSFDTISYAIDRFGDSGKCIKLEPSNPDTYTYHPCVRVPDISSKVDLASGSYTISIWAKTSSTRRMHLLSIDTFPGYNKNLNFDFNDSWGLLAYWNSEGINNLHTATSTNYSDSLWHNYILRRDKSKNSIDLFIDGIFKHSKTYSDTICTLKSMYIGQVWGYSKNYPFIGFVDDFTIWNRSISNAEILQINNKPQTEITKYLFSENGKDFYENNEDVTIYGGKFINDRYNYPSSAYALEGGDYLIINRLSDSSFFSKDFSIGMWIHTDHDSGAIVLSLEAFDGLDSNINVFINPRISNTEAGILSYTNSSINFFPFTYQTLSGNRFKYSDNKWYHLLYQRKSDTVVIFLHGKRSASVYVGNTTFGSNVKNIYIGIHPLFGVDKYKGDIDDISFYSTAISDTLIKIIANDTIGFPKVYHDVIFEHPIDTVYWAKNSSHKIRWTTDGTNNDKVVVRYSTNRITWTVIDTVPNSGEYIWKVNIDTGAYYLRIDHIKYTYRYSQSSMFYITNSQEDTNYHWELVTDTADYAPRDGAGGLVFDNKMWLLGGWNPQDPINFPYITNSEVWNSTDGINWTRVKDSANWEPRHTAVYLVHDSTMFILGGDFIQNHYQNDVWKSTDGINWDTVTTNVPWGNRVLHYGVSFKDSIWIMGGQNLENFTSTEKFYNDVWKSKNGTSWTKVLNSASWSPRGIITGSIVFNDKIWLISGGTYPTSNKPTRKFISEVWTGDGRNWTELEKPPFNGKQYHNIDTFDNKIWVIGGGELLSTFTNSNTNNVWYSSDGNNWYELLQNPFTPRHAAATFNYNGYLYLVSGNNMERDVWRIVK
jgi:Concanavalin A-like lectin/glucanases superfamily